MAANRTQRHPLSLMLLLSGGVSLGVQCTLRQNSLQLLALLLAHRFALHADPHVISVCATVLCLQRTTTRRIFWLSMKTRHMRLPSRAFCNAKVGKHSVHIAWTTPWMPCARSPLTWLSPI